MAKVLVVGRPDEVFQVIGVGFEVRVEGGTDAFPGSSIAKSAAGGQVVHRLDTQWHARPTETRNVPVGEVECAEPLLQVVLESLLWHECSLRRTVGEKRCKAMVACRSQKARVR